MTSLMERYRPYPGYKPSGVEWLGDVPAHWEIKRLKYVAALNPKASEARRLALDTEVSFVPMEAVGEYGGLDLSLTKGIADVGDGYTYFSDGDVVVAKITPCFENGKGSLAGELVNGIAFGTTELHVMRCRPELDKQFAFYLTLTDAFRKLGEAEMYGAGGQKRVPESFVTNLKHPIPPLHEQRAIAAFLDRETAWIDALVAKKERLIELLQEKRAALITRTVTKGLDPHAPTKDSGVEWLGEIPAHWEPIRLRYLASMRAGTGITSTEIEEVGEYPVFGGNGIRGYTSSYTHDGKHPLIGRQGALCGAISVASGKFWATEHAVIVEPGEQVGSDCLAYILQAMSLNQYSQSAAQPGLNIETISDVSAPVAPLVEQQSIATFLDRETAKLDSLIAKVREAIDRLRELRSALISAAVTGRIDVREEAGCK